MEHARRAGRVLDISFMSKGYIGIKTIRRPGRSSKKIGPEGLPIVSDDVNKYEKIIELLGPKYNTYLDQYKAMM